ncbi:MAG: hypothetical protein RRC07_12850 [Anaerolineae bacterium]|nr:hypothetical protein [Anaerolineae bacterium]
MYEVFLPALTVPPTFSESFELYPDAPLPLQSARWDVTVHERQLENLYELHPMAEAAHGSHCEGPPATHVVTRYEDAAYICNGHLMTALDSADPGYSLVYLTPDRMVDFERSQAVVRWDISTLPGGYRDWWDVWITPYEENLVAPLDDWLPDLNGPPRRAIHVRFSPMHLSLSAEVIDEHRSQSLPVVTRRGYDSRIVPSATQRQTFEIRLQRDRIRVGMPGLGLWWVDAPLDLDWGTGVVQFGHHSYTPHKDAGKPNTWHWDNFFMMPVVPFTMLPAGQRYADAGRPEVTFAETAPRGGMLRFSGLGAIEVSFDRGGSWQAATPQQQVTSKSGVFRTYWMAAPEGTSAVTFRSAAAEAGLWHVRDVSIWSLERVESGSG